MSLAKGPDPIKPMITFDNYVIPDTVKEIRKPAKRAPSASPVGFYFSKDQMPLERKMPKGLIVFGTFLLGVMSALYFVTPQQAPAAIAKVPQPQIPKIETALAVEPPVIEALQEKPLKIANAGIINLERAVSASLQQDVTRQETADLITPVGISPTPDLTPVSLAEILLGLTPVRAVEDQSGNVGAPNDTRTFLNRDILKLLRESVKSGTYTVKTVKRNGVERLCLRVPNANVSQDQAADLLREAAERGEIELPDAVNTAEGKFDADTLIFNLVQTSLANDGTESGAQAAKEMSRRAFIASNAKTKDVGGERVYIVQPGDSLAYLSLQFYGQPSAYPRIFEANRKILRSPDYIQVGQRLIIPG